MPFWRRKTQGSTLGLGFHVNGGLFSGGRVLGHLGGGLVSRITAAFLHTVFETLDGATPQTLRQIHDLRRSLYTFHSVQWAEREMVHAMMRAEVTLLSAETRTYLRDCVDHSIAVLDLIESYREMCNSLMELYMMGTSNRLNEVMKLLAIITTIFMPLGFIAAVYGMNFNTEAAGGLNMPELNWSFGYPLVLGIMALVVVGMVLVVVDALDEHAAAVDEEVAASDLDPAETDADRDV